ncbi:MAG: retropepsin-like aspartic protease [Saprospiraceae bacterium]
MKFYFQRDDEEGLIIVSVTLDNKYELKMALDTGATHTTIDSNALYLSGYALKDNIGTVEIETANGIIETEVFEIHDFTSLGISRKNFPIQVYDFLAHGIFSEYNGLLGLDFFEDKDFCISLVQKTIEIK